MIVKVHIGDLGEIVTGNTPPRNKPEYYGSYAPFIKATDIDETSKYTYAPEECYSELGYQKYRKSLIPKGSTCVVTIGSIGRKMTMAHCDCFINQAMNAIIPSANYDSEYVYYVIKHNVQRLKALDSGTASGRENVSKSAFSNLEIYVIDDIEIQRKIGSVLAAYDDLIENNQKQIKLLEEAAQRLYKEWFIDLRFPGHETTPIVDGIPEGWHNAVVTDLLEINYGKDHKALEDGSIPVYGSGGLMRKVNKILHSGECVLIPRKGSLNNIILVNDDFWTIDTMFFGVPRQPNVAKYVYLFLLGVDMYAMNIGAAVPSMTVKILDGMKILCPAPEILEQFENMVRPFFSMIEILKKKNKSLADARDLLLPKLMSGELEM